MELYYFSTLDARLAINLVGQYLCVYIWPITLFITQKNIINTIGSLSL